MPSSPTPMPIAVLGFGSIGRRHAGLAVDRGAAVFAYDPAGIEDPPAGVRACDSAEQALEQAHAAVIASPTSEHLAQATQALDHGCHLLVEKPLTLSAGPEAAALLDTAEERGLLLAVAMNLRFHPGPRSIRALVAEGAVGTPLAAHFSFGSYLPDWRPKVDYRRSYSARSELGGGVLLDVIHELDYARWVLGPVSEVSATLVQASNLEIDVEDVASMQLLFASGAVASMDLNYLDRSYHRGCRITGSEGTAAWSWEDERVVLMTPGGGRDERPAPSDAAPSYGGQMDAFLAAVAADDPPSAAAELVSGREAFAVLAVADAARESSRTGHRTAVAA